ncbi:hypothetical protein OY671_004403 [Metschnikowia pulcherrima]|nr:hypothetical protein OY671_004403 [Metschnikowia pulcherrima]
MSKKDRFRNKTKRILKSASKESENGANSKSADTSGPSTTSRVDSRDTNRTEPEFATNSDLAVNPALLTRDSAEEHFEAAIVASSTPIPEQPSDEITKVGDAGLDTNLASVSSPENPAFSSNTYQVDAPESNPTEESPLLRNSDLENWAGVGAGVSQRTRELRGNVSRFLHSKALLRGLIFISILALFILVIAVSVDFGKAANEAFTPEVQSISILGVHDRGVAFSVAATVESDYENIGNLFLRHFARFGSLLVGGVVITPRDKCSVYVTTNTLQSVHLLDVYPPEIAIDLIDHRVSEVEFVSDAIFAVDGAAQMFRSILQHGLSEPFDVSVEVRMSPKIQGKWFGIQLSSVSVFQNLQLPLQRYKSPLEIKDLNVKLEETSANVGFSSSLESLPMQFALGSIEWDIAVPGCNQEHISLGNWHTSSLSFEPNSPTSFEVSGSVGKIPASLLEMCRDGLTPINHFANLAVNEKKLGLFISATRSDANFETLPRWISELLTQININASIPVPHIGGDNSGYKVNDYNLETSSVIARTDNEGLLSLSVDVKSRIALHSPIDTGGFDIIASRPQSRLSLRKYNRTFLEASVVGNCEATLFSAQPGLNYLSLDYKNISVDITEPKIAGQYLGNILTRSDFDLPEWTLEVDEVFIKSPILSTIMKNLHFGGGPGLSGGMMNNKSVNSTFFDWLLKSANVSTDQIFCVSTSSQHAEFLVDFQISNPLNISVDVQENAVSLNLRYNETNVGIVTLQSLNIPKTEERVMLTAMIKLFYESSPQQVLLEDFLSHVISGSENTYFGIVGSHAKSEQGETGLSRLLQGVKIDNIRLPQLRFAQSDKLTMKTSSQFTRHTPISDHHDPEDSSKSSSPFLIDATFHLWTSEIELTVFNPLSNVELQVRILNCLASYKGESLAHIEGSETFMIPPGIYVTPRIPIKISKGIGSDILRKAMDGDLAMDVVAELGVVIDQFPAELMYRGAGLKAKVKL